MKQPPDKERDLTDRRVPALGEYARGGGGAIESELPVHQGAGLKTIPELGPARRVVRLVSASPESDLSIELQLGVNKIGRQRNGNHIALVSGEVSRFHAELQVSEDGIWVRDLGSSNGTFLNGERVQEARVEAGDTVGFSSQFLFHLQVDLPAPAPGLTGLEKGSGAPAPLAPPVASGPDHLATALEQRRRELEPGSRGQVTAELASPVGRSRPRPVPPAGAPPRAPAPASAGQPSTPNPRPAPVAPAVPAVPGRSPLRPEAALGGPPSVPIRRPPAGPPALSPKDSLMDPILSEGGAGKGEVAILERERRQLGVLYQVSKRCMAAESLAELDRLLINVLERIVSFERGFITYQLPSGDWKLVMSPKGDRWDRSVVRNLLQMALRGKAPVVVKSSLADEKLGTTGSARTDSRLLLPLRTPSAPVGAVFLISSRLDSFDDQTVDFLSLFSDIAALAVVSCGRLEGRVS